MISECCMMSFRFCLVLNSRFHPRKSTFNFRSRSFKTRILQLTNFDFKNQFLKQNFHLGRKTAANELYLWLE
jgi:hypothetical protein